MPRLLTKAAVNFSIINTMYEEVVLMFFRGGVYLMVVDVLTLRHVCSPRHMTALY